ncbi:MAG: alpha-glucosidase C-terminal domain-containing protein [Saprospiraceae bacterium]|nr:alpha-glucosidase C-terminal domain-containing protein [Saprospiraceae bacterium]
MKRFFISIFFAFLLSSSYSCGSETMGPDPMGEESVYTQYGIPFNQVPKTEDIVMYEVNLRAFSPTGNINGVIDKLDHIEALGVNVIWLMPIHPIGQVNSVNSPYSVKDYKGIASEYGTLNDLRKLTDEAHARGIAVILDWVANHTAWDNAWINNKSWYTQDGSGKITHPAGTNWLDVADLNYNNGEMRSAMIDAMKYWLYEANIDGFRCDHADGVPFDFWQIAWQQVKAIPNRSFVLFAEGERNDHFNAGFDLNFGWQSYGAIKEVFKRQPVSKIFAAHTSEYNNLPSGKHWIRFTTNHDESAWDATPIKLYNGVDGALAASVMAIFTGGVPLIYGSQEVGAVNTIPFFSNAPIDWSKNPGMLTSYQKMLQFYAGSAASRKGQNTVFPHNDVASFKKQINSEVVVILANLRNTTLNYTIPTDLENTKWKDLMTQTDVTLSGQLTLKPYQFFILTP